MLNMHTSNTRIGQFMPRFREFRGAVLHVLHSGTRSVDIRS